MDWLAFSTDPLSGLPWIASAWSAGVLAGVVAVALTLTYRGRR